MRSMAGRVSLPPSSTLAHPAHHAVHPPSSAYVFITRLWLVAQTADASSLKFRYLILPSHLFRDPHALCTIIGRKTTSGPLLVIARRHMRIH
jgi:hypothetical protein